MRQFQRRVLSAVSRIPRGRVTTYTAIARSIGARRAVRAVGTAVGKNPDAPRVPCHRVVRSDGHVGEYAFGTDKKIRLLRSEGVEVQNGKIVDFRKKFRSV